MERKYKLLLVDEDPDFLTHYGEYFVQQGFLVDVAQDGLDGLERLRHGEFIVKRLAIHSLETMVTADQSRRQNVCEHLYYPGL